MQARAAGGRSAALARPAGGRSLGASGRRKWSGHAAQPAGHAAGEDELGEHRPEHEGGVAVVDEVMVAWSSRTVQRKNVRLGDEIIEVFDPACSEHAFDCLGQALAVVIGNLEPERPRTMGHRLANPSHAHDAQRLAAQHHADAEIGRHRGRLEAGLLPGAVLEVADVLRQAAHRVQLDRVVAASSLAAGTVLQAEHLAARAFPAELVPSDSWDVAQFENLLGQVLSQPLRAGD
mgnify:CR=1 FL=1